MWCPCVACTAKVSFKDKLSHLAPHGVHSALKLQFTFQHIYNLWCAKQGILLVTFLWPQLGSFQVNVYSAYQIKLCWVSWLSGIQAHCRGFNKWKEPAVEWGIYMNETNHVSHKGGLFMIRSKLRFWHKDQMSLISYHLCLSFVWL